MKKLLTLLLMLLLCASACAENTTNEPVLPVKILEHEAASVPLADALTAAKKAVQMPEQAMIRAELAEMSDGQTLWLVTIFDTGTFMDAWCITVDAATGAIAEVNSTNEGFFAQIYAAWTAEKGPHALWSLEDKQLYDALYTMTPTYGLPMEGDMSCGNALKAALVALDLPDAEGYEVGYGYIMGGEGYNGVWEICLVQNGQVAYRVNLDAVDGEVYYMEPDEAGNG